MAADRPAPLLRMAPTTAAAQVLRRASRLGFEPIGPVHCRPHFRRRRQNSACEFDILFVARDGRPRPSAQQQQEEPPQPQPQLQPPEPEPELQQHQQPPTQPQQPQQPSVRPRHPERDWAPTGLGSTDAHRPFYVYHDVLFHGCTEVYNASALPALLATLATHRKCIRTRAAHGASPPRQCGCQARTRGEQR